MLEKRVAVKKILDEAPAFIFIGGVHGVGKTTLSDEVFRPVGYHSVTASSLIKENIASSSANKLTNNISDNQSILIRQLDITKKAQPKLLLDGHFCLIDKNSKIQLIEVEVFKSIDPDLLLILVDSPKKIADRLSKRDSEIWQIEFIQKFQEQEIQHAKKVAQKLNIELIEIDGNDTLINS